MIALVLVLFSLRLLPITLTEGPYSQGNYEDQIAYRYELAQACAEAGETRSERYLCIKIARFESHFRPDVGSCDVKGRDGEVTAWQILPRGKADRDRLCKSLAEDAKLAVERIRESRAACRRLPTPEQLALYARGNCKSESGKRLSRHRWVYRREIAPIEKGLRLPADPLVRKSADPPESRAKRATDQPTSRQAD